MSRPIFAQSGTQSQNKTAIADDSDTSKQIQFNASALATNTQAVIAADATNTGTFTLPPLTSAVLAAMNVITQTSIPATNTTVTVAATTQWYLAVPAGTLTTLNISMPSAPPNGTVVRITSTQTLTNLNMASAGSDTFVGAPTTLTANTTKGFAYLAANTAWYLI